MKLNLNGWKKVNSEKDHSILQNKDGHQLKVLHKALSKDNRKQLDKLAMADGGEVEAEDQKTWIMRGNEGNPGSDQEKGDSAVGTPVGIDMEGNSINKKSKSSGSRKLAEGGGVDPNVNPTSKPSPSKSKDDVPEADPKKAKEVQQGATESGWRPAEWKKNLKAGLGLWDGGKVPDTSVEEDQDLDTEPSVDDQQPAIQVGTMPMTPQPGAPMQVHSDPKSLPQQGVQPTAMVDQSAEQPQAPAQQEQPSMAEQAMNTEMGANKKLGDIESGGQAAMAEVQRKAAQQEQIAAATYQDNFQKMKEETLHAAHDIDSMKIDPERYWGSHSKILSAIGVALAGFGAGINGGPNNALTYIDKEIDRDVEAQKAELGKKENLMALNMKLYGDETIASNMTKAAKAASVANKMGAIAAKSGSQAAMQRAQLYQAQTLQKYGPLISQAAMIKTLNSGAAEHMDPAQFINQVVKPDQQKEVAKAVDEQKDIVKLSTPIMKNFYKAVQENTLARTIGGLRTPGSIKALEALLNTTVKIEEGSVRQAAMDSLKQRAVPQIGDSEHTIKQKEAFLGAYLQAHTSDSLMKANGLDPNKFKATRPLSVKDLTAIKYGDLSDSSNVIAGDAPKYDTMNNVKHQQVVINGKKGWLPVQ